MKKKRNKAASLVQRVEQRNKLHEFYSKHSDDFSVQINFGVCGSPDHVCIGLPHCAATEIYDKVLEFLYRQFSTNNNDTQT